MAGHEHDEHEHGDHDHGPDKAPNHRPAAPDEYKDLLGELQQIYDGQLKPCRRVAYGDLLKRK